MSDFTKLIIGIGAAYVAYHITYNLCDKYIPKMIYGVDSDVGIFDPLPSGEYQ